MTSVEFWDRLVPEPNTGCLLWGGGALATGYGYAQFENKQRLTHRIAWMIAHGPIPCGLQILHRCDTPACCNPAHLFLGSQADNMLDMHKKGRASVGERHGAKLTEADVRRIRTSHEVGRRLARDLGVSPMLISKVRNHQVWRHI